MSDIDQKPSLSATVSKAIKADLSSDNHRQKTKKIKQAGILMSVLPLAACGGSSSGGGNPDDTPDPAPSTPTPTPTPTPDFTENPTNVFIAVDGSDSVLSKAAATADLTVTGKGGDDTISTGSGDDIVDGGSGNDIISTGAGDDIVKGGPGNDTISTGTGADLIRGGNGIDAINAGADNDAIVVVGTTSANQYVQADITNPAGSGTDLSGLLTLADLNGRGVSEVSSGETIDGGTGTNTLFIYGTVDLTGVSLTNVTVLVVNSDVTLTAAQMALFTTIDGDGSSVINIEVPPGDTYIIDLSSLNITDIGNLNIDGDVTFIIDDASDLAEIGAINTGSTADVKVQINGNGGSTNVNLGDIAAKIDNADTIDLAPTVTLQVDDADDITNLGLNEISGSGNIDTGGNNDIEDALNNNVDVPKPTISINDINANEDAEVATFTVNLSKTYYNAVTVDYNAPDGSSGTLTFNPGENEKTFTSTWADDNLSDGDEKLIATLSNPSNGTIENTSGVLTIIDDEMVPIAPVTYDGYTIINENYIEKPGAFFAIINDINNDSIDDILISGASYGNLKVIFGAADNFGGSRYISELDGTNGFLIHSDVVDLHASIIASAGDINNDGLNDFIIGDPITTIGDNIYSGQAYVVFGKDGGFGASLDPYTLDGTNGFTISGLNANDRLGGGVGSIGDINNDGIDDLIVGASGANSNTGVSYIIFGKDTTFSANFDLSTLDGTNGFTFYGDQGEDYTGSEASSIGDFNGDGIDDIIICANGVDDLPDQSVGAAYIIFGSDDGFSASLNFDDLNGSNGFTVTGIDSGGSLGWSVDGIGDINNDGLDDFIIATPYAYSSGKYGDGVSYVIFGTEDEMPADFDLNSLDGTNGFEIIGADNGSLSGFTVSSAGDFNGDGISDFLIGTSSDKAFVVFGTDQSFSAQIDLSLLDGSSGFKINAQTMLGYYGDVVGGGDVNNDGFDDIIINSYTNNYNGGYVLFGRSGEWDHTIELTEINTAQHHGTVYNDEFRGTSGKDLFQIGFDSWGNDVVRDFTDGTDLIDFSGTNIDFEDLEITISGSDALIEDGDGNSIRVLEQAGNITIDDLRIPGIVGIRINNNEVRESAETMTFTVSLSEASDKTVTVDYNGPFGSEGTLTFTSGETEKTIEITWVDNDINDYDITFDEIILSNPVNAVIIDGIGDLRIRDDEGWATANINDVAVNEAEEEATFTVTLSRASAFTTSVDYMAPDGSTGTLTFAPYEIEKTFTTSWTDDLIDEDNQVLTATLYNHQILYTGDSTGELTIIDDDGTPSIRIGDISANEADETATFTVTLSNPSASTVTVDYLAPDGSSGTLTFNPGDTEKTFVTTWNDDGIDEADEVVSATLSNASNATISDGNGQLTIIDDDELPTISINDITADEADETATFTVSLSATSGKTITVDYDAPDGSSGTLTFNPGETEKTFTTTWNDDSTDEVNQTVNATLSNPSNATISDDSGKLTIYDNDPIPSISINDISINEAEEIGFFTVSLSAASGKTVSVNYSAPDGSSGTLTFNPGETEKTFVTSWSDDSTIEADEVVNATLSNATNATILDGSGALTIVDDDSKPTAAPDLANTGENSPVLIDVLANDTSFEGGDLTVIGATISNGAGSVSIIDNKIQYDPGANYAYLDDVDSAEVTISYQISESGGGTASSSVTLTISGSNNIITGTNNSEILNGTEGIDIISGLGGNDTINGYGGDDIIEGGSGANIMDGGDGIDTLSYENYGTSVNASFTYQTYNLPMPNGDKIYNFENITGSAFDDRLVGDNETNIIIGGDGDDYISGLAGDDKLYGGDGADEFNLDTGGALYVDGGDNNPGTYDIITFWNANDEIIINLATNVNGGSVAGNDTYINIEAIQGAQYYSNHLTGDKNTNILKGGYEHDFFFGMGGNDHLYGGGSDYLEGGEGADILEGTYYTDTVGYAESPEAVTINFNTMTASGGHADGDTLINVGSAVGSDYDDTIIGDYRPNQIEGGAGADILDGGDGDDTLSYAGSSVGVNVNIATNTVSGGDAAGDIISNFENIRGSAFDDTLFGTADENTIFGGGGSDQIDGGDGIDILNYIYADKGMIINMETGTADDSNGSVDTFTNIEEIQGSQFDDIITGDSNDNDLTGLRGDDIIYGGEGNDALYGHDGIDILYGGTGNDILEYSPGDSYHGGDGYDGLFIKSSFDDPIILSEMVITDIERIDLGTQDKTNDLTLSVQDIINVTDDDNFLLISGASNTQTVNISDGTWTLDYYQWGNFTDFSYAFNSDDVTLVISNKLTINGISMSTNNVPTGYFRITGTNEEKSVLSINNTLTDADGIASGYSYQWQRDGIDITGATQSTYTLTFDDAESKISVNMTYEDGNGTIETIHSADTNEIAYYDYAPGGSLTIIGDTIEGETLTFDNQITDQNGLGDFTYQWQRNGVDIEGQTGESYILTSDDVGKYIRVIARYTDGQGFEEVINSSSTDPIEIFNNPATGSVEITGLPEVGETLSVSDTLADLDGLGTITYHWLRDGVDTGVTGSNYLLESDDLNSIISVDAQYMDGKGINESVLSNETTSVLNHNFSPAGEVTISGTLIENNFLTASNSISDANGVGTVTYHWFRDGVDTGIVDSNYYLTQADVGKEISVEARYTDNDGFEEVVLSSSTSSILNVNDAPQGTVTISGITEVGKTLTVTDNITDEDGVGEITYHWYRDGVDTGETGFFYVLGEDDIGAHMSVLATYTDGQGSEESRVSTNTDVIQDPSIILLSDLDGSDGFTLSNGTAITPVSSAGDINGDGFDDIIVGAELAGFSGSVTGSAYIIFGHDAPYDAALDLSQLNGSNGFRIDGENNIDAIGNSISSAGDINGDGYDDIIVGAYRTDVNGNNSGTSYVIFGKPDSFNATFDLSTLDGSNGFRVDGLNENDFTGYSVSSAGDINGDGFDDIIIGSHGVGSSGSAYIIFGKESGYSSSFDLSTLDGSNGFRLDGESFSNVAGQSVSDAGDINNDGYDDIIIRATTYTYVVFGKADGFMATTDLSTLDGTNGFKVYVPGDEYYNMSVSSAGDINGDGYDDVLIGDPSGNVNGNGSGSSYIIFGKNGGFNSNINLSLLDGSNGFRINGAAAGDNSGSSVANAGDVNGDGFDDIIIGARSTSYDDQYSGSSYIIFGHTGNFSAAMDLGSITESEGIRIDGFGSSGNTGQWVSGAGDVNNDGLNDIIIGKTGFVIFGNENWGSAYEAPVAVDDTATVDEYIPATFDLISNDIKNGADTISVIAIDGQAVSDGTVITLSSGAEVTFNTDQTVTYYSNHIFYSLNGGLTAQDSFTYTIADNGGSTRIATVEVTIEPNPDVVHGDSNSNTIIGDENDNIIYGEGNNDSLSGLGGSDYLYGGDGIDYLRGGDGIDYLFGGDGIDHLYSGAGADFLDGGDGLDWLNYSESPEAIYGNLTTQVLTGGDAEGDTYVSLENLWGSIYNDTLYGDDGANYLRGDDGDDYIDTGAGNDSLSGGNGTDILIAGDGDDLVYVAQNEEINNDQFDGGDGTDTIRFLTLYGQTDALNIDLSTLDISNFEILERDGNGAIEVNLSFDSSDIINITDEDNTLIIAAYINNISTSSTWAYQSSVSYNPTKEFVDIYNYYTNGAATILISDGTAAANGFDGPDFGFIETDELSFPAISYEASSNNDSYYYQPEYATERIITGKDGNDVIVNLTGVNTVYGGAGNDTIYGGDDSDIIDGGNDNDIIYGFGGDDIIIGSEGADYLDGGGGLDGRIWGNDTVSYENSDTAVYVNLDTEIVYGGHAEGDTIHEFDNIIGSDYNDTLVGNDAVNSIDAGNGNDTIIASSSDSVDGGLGDDVLELQGYSNPELILDLSLIDISNIEEINLNNQLEDNTYFNINIILQDVIDVTDSDNTLIISGDDQYNVTSTGEGWVQGADQVIDSNTYHTYTGGGATLLIDDDITQDIS